jgi:hypothetical protein
VLLEARSTEGPSASTRPFSADFTGDLIAPSPRAPHSSPQSNAWKMQANPSRCNRTRTSAPIAHHQRRPAHLSGSTAMDIYTLNSQGALSTRTCAGRGRLPHRPSTAPGGIGTDARRIGKGAAAMVVALGGKINKFRTR